MRRVSVLLFSIFPTILLLAQSVAYGPLVGGVTTNSARIIVFTNTPGAVTISIAEDSLFNNVRNLPGITTIAKGNSVILDIDSLSPDTHYYYRALISNQVVTDTRTFQTYPCIGQSGNYVFGFGSCMNNNFNDDHLFVEALNHPLRFFLQIGDWGYPDVTEDLPSNPDFFTNDYARVIDSYQKKYDYLYMKEFLKTTAVDYVWDDHDYVNNNSSRYSVAYNDFSTTPPTVTEIPVPQYSRRNAIKGYYDLFPGYDPVDSTEGIFHKFRFGNVEVFALDNRAARSPNSVPLVNNNGQWEFDPPPGHSILGAPQREWLLDELRKSTATWKFIITSTVFNKSYNDAVEGLLQLPPSIGLPLAASLIDAWCGFPMDQDSLLNAVNNAKIDGVILLSGDSHSGAIDDGSAGGLPEIMAGCLSQTNSALFITAPLTPFGVVWSEGGQGVGGNVNTNDAFGKITVSGDDWVKLELIDENGSLIADHTVYSCSYLSGLKMNIDTVIHNQCYGESKGSFQLFAFGGTPPYQYTLDGETFQTSKQFNNLPAGSYHPAVKDANGCTKEVCIIIEEPTAIEATFSVTPVECYGDQNGAIDMSVSGGAPPYIYSWITGATTQDVNSIAAGTYLVNITDSKNCKALESVTVSQPAPMQINAVVENISCYGAEDGLISVQGFSGGQTPYQFAWLDSSSALLRDSLSAGGYGFILTDAAACSLQDTLWIIEPPDIQLQASVTPAYGGQNNGAATLYINGGTPAYSFLWSNGNNSNPATGLAAGNYKVIITDNKGCAKDTTIVIPAASSIKANNFHNVRIFPNPTQGNIHIEMDAREIITAEVFSLIGLKVRSTQAKAPFSIDLQDLPVGCYVVKLSSGDRQGYYKVNFIR